MVADLPPNHPGRVAVEAIYQQFVSIPGLEAARSYNVKYDDGQFTWRGVPDADTIATADPDTSQMTFYAGHTDVRRFLNTLGNRLIHNSPKQVEMGGAAAMTIRTVTHEIAHTMPATIYWQTLMNQNQKDFEEGLADAIALDVTPYIARKLFGAKYFNVSIDPEDSNYAACTRWVRKLSVSVTGAKMNSSQARRYRFNLIAATFERRNEILRQAGYDPLNKLC